MNATTATTLILIRHGEMKNPMKGITGGDSDPKLTPKGKEQAKELGVLMSRRHPDIASTAYASSQRRAAQTLEIALQAFNEEIESKEPQEDKKVEQIKKREFTTVKLESLREIGHGYTEGKAPAERNEDWRLFVQSSVEKAKEDSPLPIDYKWKNNPYPPIVGKKTPECHAALMERVIPEIIEIVKKHPGEKVAVVVHNAVIHCIVDYCKLQNSEPVDTDKYGLYKTHFERDLLPYTNPYIVRCENPNEERPLLKFQGFET